jgi:Skp family chaperone for outer membrane proteins
MKKSLTAFMMLLLCFSLKSQAQEAQQQIQTIRKNVYTRVLSLSDDEAAKFWPVFDEMQAKLNEIKKKAKIERLNIAQNYGSLTDAQMERALDNLLALEQEALDVKKKYYQKFKKVLPIKKVALLPKADREFRKELLNIYKHLKQEDN